MLFWLQVLRCSLENFSHLGCFSIFVEFYASYFNFICPPRALNCHQQKYGIHYAPLAPCWDFCERKLLLLAGDVMMLAAWRLCCNHDGLDQQHWEESFGNSSSSIRVEAKQMLVWLLWMMDESIPDGWLFVFVYINAVNTGIVWHKESVSSSTGFKICSKMLWLFLILLWITEVEHEGVIRSNDFINMLRNV